MSAHPRLIPGVRRVYKKFNISSLNELRQRIETGDVGKVFGNRMAQHIRQGLTETHAMLLYRADDLRELIEEFLLNVCHVRRAEAAGDYRRRVEVIEELVFVIVIETDDFPNVVEQLVSAPWRTNAARLAGSTMRPSPSSGILLRLQLAKRIRTGASIWSRAPDRKDISKNGLTAP